MISDETWNALFETAKARADYKKRYGEAAQKQANYMERKGKTANTMSMISGLIGTGANLYGQFGTPGKPFMGSSKGWLGD
jgi:hypothetical protein